MYENLPFIFSILSLCTITLFIFCKFYFSLERHAAKTIKSCFPITTKNFILHVSGRIKLQEGGCNGYLTIPIKAIPLDNPYAFYKGSVTIGAFIISGAATKSGINIYPAGPTYRSAGKWHYKEPPPVKWKKPEPIRIYNEAEYAISSMIKKFFS